MKRERRRTQERTRGKDQPPNTLPKGLGGRATKALVRAGYVDLRQLADVPVSRLKRIHGVGPRTLARLQEALEAEGLSLDQNS